DKLGGIAYGVEVASTLPGDLLVLVSSDAEFVRAVARGTAGGQMVVEGVAATAIEAGREMPLPLLLSTTLPADRDGDSVPDAVHWATASRQCESRGGHLATVTSAAENARIQTLAGANDRWIGLKIDHGHSPRDQWVDGEAVSFVSYASGEPNNGGTSGDPEA